MRAVIASSIASQVESASDSVPALIGTDSIDGSVADSIRFVLFTGRAANVVPKTRVIGTPRRTWFSSPDCVFSDFERGYGTDIAQPSSSGRHRRWVPATRIKIDSAPVASPAMAEGRTAHHAGSSSS